MDWYNKPNDLSRDILQTFFTYAKEKKELNNLEAYGILNSVERLEKKPQYNLNTQRVINSTTNKVETIFTITSLSEKINDHSKFNIHDIINYEKALKFYYEWDDFVVEFNKINLNWVNKNLLRRQLYYKIYIEILSQWKNSWIKNIEKIINEYIDNIWFYNKKGIDNYKAIILWNDRYNKTSVKKFNITKILNKEFIYKISKFFEWKTEIDKIKSFYKYQNIYSSIIKSYKDYLRWKINELKKYSEKTDDYDALSKEKTKKLSNVIIKINEYEKLLDSIDDLLHRNWIDDFIKELTKINDEKRKILERKIHSEVDKISSETLKYALNNIKEEYDIFKEFKYLHDFYIENIDINSKDVKKGEVIFEVIIDNSINLYDINWEKIKNPFLSIILLFDIKKDSDEFEYKIYQNWLKIIAKKSWILIEEFKNGKLNLSIDNNLFNEYQLVNDDKVDLNYNEYYTEEKLIENHCNNSNDDSNKRNSEFLWTKNETILQWLEKSFLRNIENDKYEIPKIYISKFSNTDYVKWIWLFWQYLNIWKIENYWEWRKSVNLYFWNLEWIFSWEEIIKPPIFWEKINIKFLDNDNQLISLISKDYLTLSLMWEHSILRESYYKEIEEIDFMFNYNNLDNPFLLPNNFIKNIEEKIKLLEEHIKDYDQKRKVLVMNYVNIQKILSSSDIIKNIYLSINKNLNKEITKKDNFWSLINNKNYIENYLDDLFIEIPKKIVNFWNNLKLIKIIKTFFLNLIDVFYLSEDTKKNITLVNRYQYHLNNIYYQNTEQELFIECNFWEDTIINIDWQRIESTNIISNVELKIIWKDIYLPRWIWIKINVNNWSIYINIEKTLDQMIKEKIELIDKEYFSSFSDKEYEKKDDDTKEKIKQYIERKKEEIFNRAKWLITSSRDMQKLNSIWLINNLISTKILFDIKKETKEFEKTLKK